MRRAVSAIVLAALLAAGACSSSVAGSGSAAEPERTSTRPAAPPSSPAAITDPGAAAKTDPCSLVTQDEADAIAGTKLQPKSRAEQLCTFATPTTGSPAQLEVYVGDGAKKFYDIDKINLGHRFKAVAGVGDEAHLEDGAIFCSAKGTWIGLRLLRLDSVDTGPSLIQLAKIAVGRLP
jgi:hypothetical protein